MKIGGFQKQSLIDYPGKVASIIFTVGCNFRCPFCHNYELLCTGKAEEFDQEKILDYFKQNKNLLDGVVVTGGEPTLHEDLTEFIKKIKKLGLLVKLDTNGTNFEVLQKLIKEGLVDFVAIDVKNSLDFGKYNKTVGNVLTKEQFENVKKSLELIKGSGVEYEFRTTISKELHSEKDILQLCQDIKPAKHYSIQNFRQDNVLKTFNSFSEEEMVRLVEKCSSFIDSVSHR
ncbi:anaerobic ribonucleoside-triphosphate reductase activating protein [Nanoarchaeota archaeon]